MSNLDIELFITWLYKWLYLFAAFFQGDLKSANLMHNKVQTEWLYMGVKKHK